MSDAVKPGHYRQHPKGVMANDIMEHLRGNCSQVFKYVWRYMDKVNPKQDLDKACWYLQREVRLCKHVPNPLNEVDPEAIDQLALKPLLEEGWHESQIAALWHIFLYDRSGHVHELLRAQDHIDVLREQFSHASTH